MKKKLIVLSGILVLAVLVVAPAMVLAQQTGADITTTCLSKESVTNLTTILCKISELLNAIIPILVTLGIVYFVYGVITYVIASDEEAKKKGRDRVIYGIIGLAVIIGVWGLVVILRDSFIGSNANNKKIEFPTVPYNIKQ